jgi:aarF domain-containing kinase
MWAVVIDGARVDDLKYLKEHGIDRNQVSQELSKIFSQMVYINGCESLAQSWSDSMLTPRRLPRRPAPRQPPHPPQSTEKQ